MGNFMGSTSDIILTFADSSQIEIDDPKMTISLDKGIMDLPIPSESGDSPEDIQASGSLIMAMGGTSKKVNISYTIVGSDVASFRTEFNRQYKLYATFTLGDTLTMTVNHLIDGTGSGLDGLLWKDVPVVLKNVSFRFMPGTPTAVEVSITLIIGQSAG